MPPKNDPYATRSARAADLLLIVITLLAILLAIWTAPTHQSDSGKTSSGFNSTFATR